MAKFAGQPGRALIQLTVQTKATAGAGTDNSAEHPALADVLADSGVPLMRVQTLDEAVAKAAELAQSGDAVLLSPACASLDMFKNFEERGRLFAQAVEALQ